MSWKVKIKLRVAKNSDFTDFVGYVGPQKKKTYKFRIGVPYWVINSKGKIENQHYISTEATDMETFKELLKNGQILVPKETKYKNGRAKT